MEDIYAFMDQVSSVAVPVGLLLICLLMLLVVGSLKKKNQQAAARSLQEDPTDNRVTRTVSKDIVVWERVQGSSKRRPVTYTLYQELNREGQVVRQYKEPTHFDDIIRPSSMETMSEEDAADTTVPETVGYLW